MTASRRRAFLQGAWQIMPLSLACAPWGILVGALAIETGLSVLEGQAFSLLVFAGAAQLVALGMLKAGAGLAAILLTTLLLTSQHLLYGLHMRRVLAPQPLPWRLGFGFLLTDEFFALNHAEQPAGFDRWRALGMGLSFYLLWNLFTLAGLLLGRVLPNLGALGLDFSIAATFIALVVPLVRDLATVACVLTALLVSVWLHHLQWQGALVLGGLAGMSVGFLVRRLRERLQ
ncbi:AzlC family ABC transporter permease [Pseudomonas benzopyrenica]|uniref:AzlC family ABC transporter permease n=1 Tax=Pseudomonas benzopyrenica TaxID=2993566 RepID=UPI001610BCA0